MSRGRCKVKLWVGLACLVMLTAVEVRIARADAFTDYGLTETFGLPGSSPVFDVLGDGRLVTLVDTNVYAETAIGSRSFSSIGVLDGADIGPYGAAFLRVSPDGTRFAVGNGGGTSYTNYEVGVFNLDGLVGDWFSVDHFDAEWINDVDLAVTAGAGGPPGVVTALDTSSSPSSPTNPIVITNIGGYSGGITFDAAGNLYTGNGYDDTGPSDTGWIKAFSDERWEAALSGGPAVDFEAEGTLIADLLSAAALGFDAEGNLHVGGGDYLGGAEQDNAALVRGTAVADALAGGGPADPADPLEVRRFDPDIANPYNYYDVNYNDVTGELYFREGGTVYTYVVPEPASLVLLAAGMMIVVTRKTRSRRLADSRGGERGGAATFNPRGLSSRREASSPCDGLRGPMDAALRGHGLSRPGSGQIKCIMPAFAVILCSLWPSATRAESPFATAVVDFSPAPGQFVNEPLYNDPIKVLGAPIGGGTYNPDNSKLVNLGGFGGSITLAFDHTVMDDVTNPLSLDAIVFGNATWVDNNPNRHWAECGVIEISRDVNGNGLADDPWYLIPGSHITDTAGQWEIQTWDDNTGDPTYTPDNTNWIPPGRTGEWDTQGYRLPADVFDVTILENPNGLDATEEGIFGYADLHPVLILGDLDADNVVDDPAISPEHFYTTPDDPFTVGITPDSGGGDAFDIAWAIDAATREPAGLDGFDFIRITNGENHVAGIFGEKSPEIGAVADVLPGDGDMNCDGALSGLDVSPFVLAIIDPTGYEQAYPDCNRRNADVNDDGVVDTFDIDPFVAELTGV
ncbi:MAG: PEP-CTERM sorting domain-containing protein [Phycisphaerae bacterium]|nr:PEP-CTERM sorting domain-containing protein [Phycisphaerae bacterium]